MSRTRSRTFIWHFDQPPARMWPALADTARFNEAAGLPRHAIEEVQAADGTVRFFAEARVGPVRLAWEEIPVEWVDRRRFRHIRLFSKGPLRSLTATLRLAPAANGGSTGHYTVEAEAANPLGSLILRTGFFPVAGRLFTRLAMQARDWALAPRAAVELCLQAVKSGLLELRWDLLCPRCRGAKIVATSLDQVPSEAHCGACNIGYDRDFARNVELSFQPNPAIRRILEGEFCLFGPMTTPHIKLQATLAADETRQIDLDLPAGPYRLRTLQVGGAEDVEFDGDGFPALEAEAGEVRAGPSAPAGSIDLVNREDRPRTLIIESRDWAADALTAHRATALQCFRDLFPQEGLRPGDAVDITRVALVFTDLEGSTAFFERVGDVEAYRLVREHFGFLAEAVREADGAIVKTIGDAVMAVFVDPADALRAALSMQAKAADYRAETGAADIILKVGVHTGACVAVSLNDRLDYFGGTVNMAARLQGESAGGEIVLSADIVADPGAATVLNSVPPQAEQRPLRGFADPITLFRLDETAVARLNEA